MDDWTTVIRDQLTKQLVDLSIRQTDRAEKFSTYGLFGLIVTGVSIWRASSGDSWYLLGVIAGPVLFVACLVLWINAKVEERYLVRRIDEVERNWSTRP